MSAAEVRSLRVALASDCNLRCTYCFVDKDAGERLDPALGLRAVDWLLESPGRDKTLDFYGGEPLLHAGTLRTLAARAREQAGRLGKRLTVRVAANGTRLPEDAVSFLRELDARLHVSIDGGREAHDRRRVGPDGRGSWDEARRGVERLLGSFAESRLTALVGVAPEAAGRAAESLAEVERLGLRNLNVETIFGEPWTPEALGALSASLDRFWKGLLERAGGGEAPFLVPVARSLRPEGGEGCGLVRRLELFPDGSYHAHSYPLPAGADPRASRLGDAGSPPRPGCAGGPSCRCRESYLAGLPSRPGGEAWALRERLCAGYGRELAVRALGSPPHRRYLAEALRRAEVR